MISNLFTFLAPQLSNPPQKNIFLVQQQTPPTPPKKGKTGDPFPNPRQKTITADDEIPQGDEIFTQLEPGGLGSNRPQPPPFGTQPRWAPNRPLWGCGAPVNDLKINGWLVEITHPYK